jgi:hypothetical protein
VARAFAKRVSGVCRGVACFLFAATRTDRSWPIMTDHDTPGAIEARFTPMHAAKRPARGQLKKRGISLREQMQI